MAKSGDEICGREPARGGGHRRTGGKSLKKETERRQFLKQAVLGTVLEPTMINADSTSKSNASTFQPKADVSAVSGRDRIPSVEPIAMVSGALLADSFDARTIDEKLWSRPNWMTEHDPYIAVNAENSRLRISGSSHPAGKENQYVGILSKYFRETDVVLAVRMRIRTLFGKVGRIRHIAHLCTGDWPDFFMEINFGTTEAGLPPRWFGGYVDRIWNYAGYSNYLEPALPASGEEARTWHDVAIRHDGITQETQSYLIQAGHWKPVGPPAKLHFNHAHVELKVDVGIGGVKVDMEFDDARLYRNPAHTPVMIVVSSPVVEQTRPETPIHNLEARVFDEETGSLLGKGRTDHGGQCPVLLETNVLYPVPARIEVWSGDQQVLEGRIHCLGVQGLYPGDVWMLRFSPKR
jgi:hypothetical protein